MSSVAVTPTARITGRLKGRLMVVAHQARDLQSKQMLGTMDPYCVLSVRSEKIKSIVHTDGGRTPRWEHSFIFNIDCDENEVLHVKVMNKEMVTDDTVGMASIALKDLVVYHQVRRWYQLVDKNNFSKIAGALEMTVDYQGEGVEYFLKVNPAPAATITPTATPAAATSYVPPAATAYPAVSPAPAPAPAPAPSPAPPAYIPPVSAAPAAAPYYPPPAATPPSPYGYPPSQPSYAPPQPAYAPPPAGYYPPPAAAPAPYGGYAPPPAQPIYYAPPPVVVQQQPQVVYAAPPQPTVIYQQPQPEVVIIEERRGPLFW